MTPAAAARPHRATRDRRDALMGLVRSGTVRVEDLAERLDVSPSTVRRDLAALESDGHVSRTYGGAITGAPYRDRALGERLAANSTGKARIGRAALDLVHDGATVFVDAGSTTIAFVEALRDTAVRDLTVVTRGVENAVLLVGREGIDVHVAGGRLTPASHGTTGPLTLEALGRFSFDVAVLGCDAVSPVSGVGEPTLEEAYVKEFAASRSARTAVLADASKFHVSGISAWAHLPAGWTLVTDHRDEEALAQFAAAGVRVVSTAGDAS
ncbi:MAG TPA: DeoR/GlpR family DNA-binding transcription regulator [Brevibacterium senegalense]|uniref:Lactose phosphotransferase system repressor n=1 Tax=Brevibacterium senegalense TaxID=1033736 RepID=A0A921SMZ4_9MICO|nr:DeoR/GlpR family DNA-binding transcription regulator [Brevibacterium senegalense]HJG79362.1 DeoR/GlpR family DNA-binding transcription regulator [Brevibacterium senegalense]